MGIIKGYIEGAMMVDPDTGDAYCVPHQSVTEATFEYNGELYIVETFDLQGDKTASAACSSRKEAKFTLTTEDLNWSFLQAATGTLDAAATRPILASETVIVAAGATTVALSRPVSETITSAAVADVKTGKQYTLATQPAGAAVSLTLAATPSATDATVVRVTYWRDPDDTTAERVIELGKGTKIREGGVYGRFVGCGDIYVVTARRVVTKPSLNFGVGSNPASASVELQCLQDSYGILATITKLNPGDSV